MILRAAITVLCGVGLYASIFMLRKSRRAERGELTEPSVVQTRRARLFGPPNALLGICYYPAFALAIWLSTALRAAPLLLAALAAAITAGAVSVLLAYSLLFKTRMPCPYCWASHVVNWLLAALTAALIPSAS